MSDEQTKSSVDATGDRRWRKQGVLRWLEGVSPSEAPRAVVVAGQPGSGKGAVVDDLCYYFADYGNCAVIDAAELAYLHPNFAPAAEEDNGSALTRMREEAEALACELLAEAVDRQLHLVIDTTLPTPGQATELADTLKGRAYHVTVIALCVDAETSWQSVESKNVQLQQELGFTRPITRQAHDEAFKDLVQSLAALANQSAVDEVHVINRHGEALAACDRSQGFNADRITAPFQWLGAGADPAASLTTSSTNAGRQKDKRQVPSSVVAGGRMVKLGAFSKTQLATSSPNEAAKESEESLNGASADRSAARRSDSQKSRGMKLRPFPIAASSPASEPPQEAAPPPAIPAVGKEDEADGGGEYESSNQISDESFASPNCETYLPPPSFVDLEALPTSKHPAVERRIRLQQKLREYADFPDDEVSTGDRIAGIGPSKQGGGNE